MNNKNTIKYPKNAKIKARLIIGDRRKIADATGYKPSTIHEIVSGYRRMPDKVKQAIIDLINERDHLQRTFDQLSNQ